MAEKILNTRVQLRYDSLTNWTSKNPELKKGEVAIAYLATSHTTTTPDNNTHPVLMKVGPGAFNALPWMSALAADVYEWAKKNEIKIDVPTGSNGNAVTNVEIKDGFLTFTKGTKFATKAELDAAIEAFGGDLSAITDNDHQYSFTITEGKLVITAVNYVNGKAGESTQVASLDFVTPDELTDALGNYYTKNEADGKFVAKGDINTKDSAGLVAKGSEGIGPAGARGKVWGTDSEGNPGWKDPIMDGLIALAPHTTDDITWASYETNELAASALGQVYINHAEVAKTAKNATTLEDKTLGLGEKITVFEPLYDKYGHIKSTEKVEFTLPNATDVAGVKVNEATKADTADEATHAGSADEATHAASATHADAATKVDNALTVKIGGADVVFDGSKAETIDIDDAIPEYSIVKDTTTTSEYAATYHLTKDGEKVGTAINIPKDLVVESGKVETLEEGDWGPAGTYIVLTLANATNDKIYVRVDDLIEYVTSGSTDDSQVIVAIDGDHKVTATIGAGKIGTTELADKAVTTDKIALGAVDSAQLADQAVTPDKLVDGGVLTEKIEDKAVTKAKLADDIQTSLGKADTAVQPGDLGTMAKETATDYVKAGTVDDVAGMMTGFGLLNLVNTKADDADVVKTITPVAGNGLKATKTGNDVSLDWDPDVVFVFNCGDAAGNPLN